ncbi:MAG: hypothetical protein RLZZ77_1317 [Bacteroidota bacterium]|jgi:4,5-DOPA dioxygenase extradiol
MKRSDFLKALAILPVGAAAMQLTDLKLFTQDLPKTERYPVIFIGHGSPQNVIFDNRFTQDLAKTGQRLERPKAILCISAHWLTRGSYISVNPKPETIYDFGGFPEEMYHIKYPAPGHPELASLTASLSEKVKIEHDHSMGLDHGAWAVLRHMYPDADIPVFQMSIDYSKNAQWHFELAQELQAIREKGVMIIASGNIVHNLGVFDFSSIDAPIMGWAGEFDAAVKSRLESRNFGELQTYQNLPQWKMAVPSNDHYLPMIYALGMTNTKDEFGYIHEGFQYGSISMRSFIFS